MAADFSDLESANREFVASFVPEGQSGRAAKGLAIVTCMDSRIAPLAIVGMKPGDAKILRNAGARVTDDVLRTLVLATHLLGVNRVLVMPHTDCRMATGTEPEIHKAIFDAQALTLEVWRFERLPINEPRWKWISRESRHTPCYPVI